MIDLARLRDGLGWPRGRDVTDLVPWLELITELAAGRGAEELARLAAETIRDPDSPDRLFALGYALIDAGLPAVAASILWRCLGLVGDSEEVVCELVSALETALAYEDAFAILDARPALREQSFLCRYLHAFDAAMTGRLEVARVVLPTLVPAGEETAAMAATIAGMLERAARVAGACPLDERDLRGWHYVLTGGLLVHQSPYGFEAPMHGRYAWLADSAARIATGLDRLATLAAGAPCIYAPPGRGHEIVARAAAARLGIPRAPWPAVGVPAPGIVVVHDLAQLDDDVLAALAVRRPGQILYAHASPWTQDAPIAADVTMVLYQSLVAPWTAEATADDVVAEIAASPGLDAEELGADQPERWAALVHRAWPLSPGPRSRQWAGGPVPSNRFE